VTTLNDAMVGDICHYGINTSSLTEVLRSSPVFQARIVSGCRDSYGYKFCFLFVSMTKCVLRWPELPFVLFATRRLKIIGFIRVGTIQGFFLCFKKCFRWCEHPTAKHYTRSSSIFTRKKNYVPATLTLRMRSFTGFYLHHTNNLCILYIDAQEEYHENYI